MAYDDAAYLKAIEQLDNAVVELLANEVSVLDIHEAVDTAIQNNAEE